MRASASEFTFELHADWQVRLKLLCGLRAIALPLVTALLSMHWY